MTLLESHANNSSVCTSTESSPNKNRTDAQSYVVTTSSDAFSAFVCFSERYVYAEDARMTPGYGQDTSSRKFTKQILLHLLGRGELMGPGLLLLQTSEKRQCGYNKWCLR